jgi:DNA-binding NarL/FixJ family response regulator
MALFLSLTVMPMNDTDMTQAENGNTPKLACYIVEDSPLILQSLIETLEHMVAVKVVGMSGESSKACAWLLEHARQVDVVITDIFLKQGNGLDVLKCLQTLPAPCAKIVLTNYATDAMRERCLALGADQVFDKSSELDEFIAYCASLQPSLS